MTANRENYQANYLLGKDQQISSDSWKTNLNNNNLVLGPSGSHKTRDVVKPNLLQMGSSFVVLDTKGLLRREVGPVLESHGYEIWHLDFAHHFKGNVGYDPLSNLEYEVSEFGGSQRVRETSVLSVGVGLCPNEDRREPFWAHAAQRMISALILLAVEQAPEGCACFSDVIQLYQGLFDGENAGESTTGKKVAAWRVSHPQSPAAAMWERALGVVDADRTWACIIAFVENALHILATAEAKDMFERANRLDFTQLAQKRVALFVTVSDTDPTLRRVVNVFISQAFDGLIRYADEECEGGRLPIPVRFILDDFSNLYIPNAADILSVVRSREIWVTCLCQSVMQLNARYGNADAMSIIANCDTQLLLGFCDNATADFYSKRCNKPSSLLLESGLDDAWLVIRGQKAKRIIRYELTDHPLYGSLPEAKQKASA